MLVLFNSIDFFVHLKICHIIIHRSKLNWSRFRGCLLTIMCMKLVHWIEKGWIIKLHIVLCLFEPLSKTCLNGTKFTWSFNMIIFMKYCLGVKKMLILFNSIDFCIYLIICCIIIHRSKLNWTRFRRCSLTVMFVELVHRIEEWWIMKFHIVIWLFEPLSNTSLNGANFTRSFNMIIFMKFCLGVKKMLILFNSINFLINIIICSIIFHPSNLSGSGFMCRLLTIMFVKFVAWIEQGGIFELHIILCLFKILRPASLNRANFTRCFHIVSFMEFCLRVITAVLVLSNPINFQFLIKICNFIINSSSLNGSGFARCTLTIMCVELALGIEEGRIIKLHLVFCLFVILSPTNLN